VLLGRNALLGAIAGTVLILDRPESSGLNAPEGAELLPAALVVAGTTLAVWMLWRVSAAFRGKARG
jgi:hypothetical protein